MQVKTHQLVGFGFAMGSLIGAKHLNININDIDKIVFSGSSVLGSIIPDMDCTESTFGRRVPFFSYPIHWLSMFFGFLSKKTKGKAKKFWAFLSKFFGHRGICHYGLLWLLLFYLSFSITENIYQAIALGITIGGISHLCADSLNPSGIPWILPNSRIHIANIVTGSREELIFRGVVAITDILLAFLFLKGVFQWM